MRIIKVALMFSLIFSTACAPTLHTWTEGYPQENSYLLSNPEKKIEFEKFAISGIERNSVYFKSDYSIKHYSLGSFLPVINKVDPNSDIYLKEAQKFTFYSQVLDWIVLGTLLIPSTSSTFFYGNKDYNTISIFGWSLFGVSVLLNSIFRFYEINSYENMHREYLKKLNENIYSNRKDSENMTDNNLALGFQFKF